VKEVCRGILLLLTCSFLAGCATPQTPNQLLTLPPEKESTSSGSFECLYSRALDYRNQSDAFISRDEEKAWFSTAFALILIKQTNPQNSKIELFRHSTGKFFGHLDNIFTYLQSSKCDTTNNNISNPIDPEMARVFFYRVGDGKFFGPSGVYVYEQGKRISELNSYRYSTHFFKPGAYRFSAKWDLMRKPLFEGIDLGEKTLEINLKAGETYFINYKITQDFERTNPAEQQSLLGKILSKPHMESVEFILEADDVGRKKVAVCRPAEKI
jgi:hypothetical protein